MKANVSIKKIMSAKAVSDEKPLQVDEPKAEQTKPDEVIATEDTKPEEEKPTAEDNKQDENEMCMCPMCEGSGKVKAEDKKEDKPVAEDTKPKEEKLDSEDGDPAPEDEKDEEIAEDVKPEKEDVYAKGKALKHADMSDVFKKEYVSDKQKAFVENLYKSIGAEEWMPKL